MPVFSSNIPDELRVGDRIEIGGKIKDNAKKMSVNLCTQHGQEPKDVVLHFDVRFHRDNIISLSRKNGIWIGSGNYDTNYNMFVPGTMFQIAFEIKEIDVITIYCQGKFHSNFLPKIPLCMAKFVVAWGDMERVSSCYFVLGKKRGCEAMSATPSPWPIVSTAAATAITDDLKRQGGPQKVNNSTSDDGIASDILYDALMYPNRRKDKDKTHKSERLPKDSEHTRKFPNISELSDCSEEVSKTIDYSNDDVVDRMKRRKCKFPFSHVANFINRTRRI